MTHQTKATMTLTTSSAVALWNVELRGQLSDGAWENAAPRNHWEFWSDTKVVLGDKIGLEFYSYSRPRKTSYGFAAQLISVVGDRMLAYGRMARACDVCFGAVKGSEMDEAAENMIHAADYMPKTYEEFAAAKESGKWAYDFVARYMVDVDLELAKVFYSVQYTEKDLRIDLRIIGSAMKAQGTDSVRMAS